jgi:hypothetical protein
MIQHGNASLWRNPELQRDAMSREYERSTDAGQPDSLPELRAR